MTKAQARDALREHQEFRAVSNAAPESNAKTAWRFLQSQTNRVIVRNTHGEFRAPLDEVLLTLDGYTRTELVARAFDAYSQSFTKMELRHTPSFILAVYLCQV